MMLPNDSVERFVSTLQGEYTDASELDRICNIIDYDAARNPEREDYIQVGRKTWFPKAIIEDGISIFNAEQITKRIADGEIDAILSSLSELADEGSIISDSVEGFTIDDIISVVADVPEPDHLFLPSSDELWDSRWSWEKQGLVTYEGDAEILNVAGNQLEIHMLREESDIEDIFVIDSSRIDIVQKTHDNALDPQGEEAWEMYPEYNSGQPFMMYFDGEKVDPDDEDFPEKVKILYRVVFSTPSVGSKNSAYRLEIPD